MRLGLRPCGMDPGRCTLVRGLWALAVAPLAPGQAGTCLWLLV